LQTSVSESVSFGRRLPVTGSLDGEAVRWSALVPARSVLPICRSGTVTEATFVQVLLVLSGG
jgi:hypothetical protein